MNELLGPIQLVLNYGTEFGNAVAKEHGAIAWEIKALNY